MGSRRWRFPAAIEGAIHLVLTDVVMPRMRGPDMAGQIVKQRPGIAVVFLSGYTEEVISQSDGISGFTLVEKPYSADALLHSIRRTLDDRSARDSRLSQGSSITNSTAPGGRALFRAMPT